MRIVIAVVALLAAPALAQIETDLGRDFPYAPPTESERQSFNDHGGAVFIVPPQADNSVLAEEASKMGSGGYDFAKPVDFLMDPHEQGKWEKVDGGFVWRGTFVSRGATSISVTFDKFFLPQGCAMWVYNDQEIKGAYTHKNNAKNGFFGFFPLRGDWVTVEVFKPEISIFMMEPQFHVATVAHGFAPALNHDRATLARFCNINVECDRGEWGDQIRAVVAMISASGSRFCSGSMINNAENAPKQFMLTAAHCTVGSSNGVMFNYESQYCDRDDGARTDQTAFGLESLGRLSASDYNLFEVGEEIPAEYNVFLAGYSAVDEPCQHSVALSHPSGRVKKIAYANSTCESHRWSSGEPGDWHWKVPFWDAGTTEPGSSGSPLFDENKRIVGQLHGGTASCRNPRGWDSYGALWASWDKPSADSDKAQTYLDPNNTGKRVNDGIDLNKARLLYRKKTPSVIVHAK